MGVEGHQSPAREHQVHQTEQRKQWRLVLGETAVARLAVLGAKASIAVTHKSGLIVGARTFPGNPYDGHVLAAQLEQTGVLLQDIGRKPKQVFVDLGYRGFDADNPDVEILHRGKYKSMNKQQRRWLKRRQAVEPAIGHLKADHRMDRCWLAGSMGDALHAVLCAAGFNLRWLMRAIARLFAKQHSWVSILAALRVTLSWIGAVLADSRRMTLPLSAAR